MVSHEHQQTEKIIEKNKELDFKASESNVATSLVYSLSIVPLLPLKLAARILAAARAANAAGLCSAPDV